MVSTVFVDVAALYWLAVPLPWVWGLLSYIPNVGFFIGLVPPAVLALRLNGVASMIAVIVAYSVINVVLQHSCSPR